MRNSIWRILVVTFAVALVGAFLPFNSASAQSPESCAVDIADYEGSAILTVDPLTVAPGGTVTITGAGFPPNSTVPLSFNGQQFATPVTDDLGAFTVPFTVPADTPPGPVEFEAICGAFTLTSIVQVTGTPATPPPTVPGGDSGGTLTPTGSNSLQLVQVAAALLVAGGLLLFLARRQARRRVPATVQV